MCHNVCKVNGQGARTLSIHLSYLNVLKEFFNSDIIPDAGKAILKITNLPTYYLVDFSPWWQNMDLQIMQKSISERLSFPKFDTE